MGPKLEQEKKGEVHGMFVDRQMERIHELVSKRFPSVVLLRKKSWHTGSWEWTSKEARDTEWPDSDTVKVKSLIQGTW